MSATNQSQLRVAHNYIEFYKAQTNDVAGYEILLRKWFNRMGKRGPMKSRLNVVENVEKWGVGALNIDATRIEFTDDVNLDNKLPSGNNQFKNKNKVN